MAANAEAEHTFVFSDTLYEDADCYRFLIEGIAHLLGRKLNWSIPRADDFPDYRVSPETTMAEYAGNPEWRAFLAQLREDTALAIPELVWLVEGRDPWEIFRDEKFLGNGRFDPCSKALKRKQFDRWQRENCDPQTSVLCIGIGPHEAHRYQRLAVRGRAEGWTFEAPLIGMFEGEVGAFGYLADAGIARPRLYDLGYMHNNCGGFCIKAGHAHYLNRLRSQPERFAYDAMMEAKLAEYIGKPVSMLTDRSGDGVKKLLTLATFAAGVNAQTEFDYAPGDSGCGCMLDTAA